jgi:hypothetical protein
MQAPALSFFDGTATTVKQHLACIRMLFDWLVTGTVMPVPAGTSSPQDVRACCLKSPQRQVNNCLYPVALNRTFIQQQDILDRHADRKRTRSQHYRTTRLPVK